MDSSKCSLRQPELSLSDTVIEGARQHVESIPYLVLEMHLAMFLQKMMVVLLEPSNDANALWAQTRGGQG